MDKSLEKLNFTKLALYALAFIALCGGLLFFLINPLVKSYQAAQVELVAQIQSNLIAKNALDASTERLNALKAENATLLSQLDKDFNLTNFVNFLSRYFKSASFSEILRASSSNASNGDGVNKATSSGNFEQKDGKLNAQLFEMSGFESDDLGANYLQYELNATARLTHPKKFYEFINALKSYEKLVKIEAPIEFTSRKDGDINANFRLKIYSTKAYNEKNSQKSQKNP